MVLDISATEYPKAGFLYMSSLVWSHFNGWVIMGVYI